MSFFKNILGGSSQPVSLNRQEGYCGMLLAIIAADGQITNDEVTDFYSAVQKARLLQDISESYFRNMMDKLIRVLKKQGLDELMELSAAGLTPELYKPTFVNAMDLVFSDGHVDPDEIKVMDKMKVLLGIDDQFAAMAGEVMKTKGSV